jgi:hypothetical protein
VSNRLRPLIAGLACVIVAAVVAVLAINPFSSSGPAQPTPRVTTTVNPAPVSNGATAPVPPARGAYFGAWVGPDDFTQLNEINSVQELQRQIGRKLSIVHTYVKWQAPFPTTSALTFLNQPGSRLLISWAGTDTREINSGADDGWIRTRAAQIKTLGQPVFLEWRWEMDRPNLRSQVHSGADYVKAWDRIRTIFAAAGVGNAAWVWCPTAKGFSDGQAAAFYPGDAEVDWICADAYPEYGSRATFGSTVTAFLGWASHHDKPVMIGEFGVPVSYGGQQRAQWLRAAQQVVLGDRQIKALLYFDANPAGQGPEGSYSLGGDPAALAVFRTIARQPYFNPAGSR